MCDMTLGSASGDAVYVEGRDDHAIGQLLIRRGADPEGLLGFVNSGGKEGVLGAIRVSIGAGTGRSFGFVVDANDDLDATWRAVCSRLGSAGVDAPDQIPRDGFVGESSEFGARVGVWLMPDNRQTGALEDFLTDLIEVGDQLLPCQARDNCSERGSGRGFVLTTPGRRFSTRRSLGSVSLDVPMAWRSRPTIFVTTATPRGGSSFGSVVCSGFWRMDDLMMVAACRSIGAGSGDADPWVDPQLGRAAPDDLAMASHGRGFWSLANIAPLGQLDATTTDRCLVLFTNRGLAGLPEKLEEVNAVWRGVGDRADCGGGETGCNAGLGGWR